MTDYPAIDQDAAHKARDAQSYDELAEAFDHFTDMVSVDAARRLVSAIPEARGGHVLDIGCGTGIVTLTAAEQLGPETKISGLDLSEGMLAVATRKAKDRGLAGQVAFVRGDAEALDFADGSVDAVVSLYAWRHFPNPEKAAAEVFRVLKPGGLFAVAVGSRAPLLSPAGIANAFSVLLSKLAQARGRELAANAHIDALVERMLPRTAGDEVAEWTKAHHGFSGSLQKLVSDAGFRILRSGWTGKTFDFSSSEDFWQLQSTFSSMARKRIADASPENAQALRAEFDRETGRVLAAGGRLVYRVGAAIVIARKP
jgi:ubiquinone/menaquinone biosynthesis C-methylase UbiE